MLEGPVSRRNWMQAAALVFAGARWSPVQGARLSDLINASRLSVCAVGTFNPLDNPRFSFRGSGFVIGDTGLVATCWHVLPDAAASTRPGVSTLAIGVPSADGLQMVEAELAGSDRGKDLAVLRPRQRMAAGLPLAAGSAIREGGDVALLGFPIGGTLGYRLVTHRGIVASIVASSLPGASARQLDEGAVSRLREGAFELLQLDATAYPGNSGGPVIDLETGQVIGLVDMVLVKGNRESALSSPTGITYAIPVRYLKDLLARL